MDRHPGLSTDVRDAIVDWYATHGRTLAFRRTTDPYAVLVSEVIAQQTQAPRAAARWERFMLRFPSVDALATASPADVLREWQGLGYNRRALALWRAACAIRDEHGGCVPDDVGALERLPGVGPYTARAVAAIAFGRPVGAVDVNVRRVLARILGGRDGLPRPAIQAAADLAAATTDPGTWTHSVMDLGATVCRPRQPRCDACPVRAVCRYAGTQAAPNAEARIRRNTPFPSTTRWLRGRIIDRLRAVTGDDWITFDEPIGAHPLEHVHAATEALANEGLVEISRRSPTSLDARLATA